MLVRNAYTEAYNAGDTPEGDRASM
ncbi:hypothetical protein LCGC14_2944160, partial [marine sediment metagenome]